MSHTSKYAKTTFIHNGNIKGGEVEIINFPNKERIKVDADDLTEFILDQLISQKIEELEGMSGEKLREYFIKK